MKGKWGRIMSKPGNIFGCSLYDDILLSDEELENFDEYEKKTLREEGFEEGYLKGLAMVERAIVLKMYDDGKDIKTIMEYTELTQEEIENIIEQEKNKKS